MRGRQHREALSLVGGDPHAGMEIEAVLARVTTSEVRVPDSANI